MTLRAASLPVSVSQAGLLAVQGLTAGSTAAASSNTSILQSSLNSGGNVTVLTPGTYWINDTLTYYSNTNLTLAAGVVIKLVNSTNKSFLQNSCMASSVITVSNQITCSAPSANYFCTGTADCGANAHGLVVGDWVLIKGDTSKQYNKVVQVLSVTNAFIFTFTICSKTALTVSTGTVTIRKANVNVTISGGTWDYNGQNQVYVTGVRATGIIANNIGNFTFCDSTYLNGLKWVTNIGNAYGVTVSNIELDTASDGPHICGNVVDCLIDNIRGVAGDDMVALEQEPALFVADEAITGGDQNGDFVNITVSNVFCKATSEAVVAVYPSGPYEVSNLIIENIDCAELCNHGVYFATSTGNTVTGFRDVTMRNIKIRNFSSRAIRFGAGVTDGTGGFNVNKILIDGLDIGIANKTVYPIQFEETTCANLKIFGHGTYNMDSTSGPMYFLIADNTSSLTDLVISNCTINNASGSNGSYLVAHSGPESRSKYSANTFIGTASIYAGSPTGTPNIDVSNNYFSSNVAIYVNFSCDLLYRDNIHGSLAGNAAITFYGSSYNSSLRVYGNNWGTTNNWLRIGTSSGDNMTVNLWASGNGAAAGYGTGITYTSSSYTLYLRQMDAALPVDAAKFTGIDNGCIYQNSNAAYSAGAGVYVKGPTTATRIAT